MAAGGKNSTGSPSGTKHDEATVLTIEEEPDAAGPAVSGRIHLANRAVSSFSRRPADRSCREHSAAADRASLARSAAAADRASGRLLVSTLEYGSDYSLEYLFSVRF